MKRREEQAEYDRVYETHQERLQSVEADDPNTVGITILLPLLNNVHSATKCILLVL